MTTLDELRRANLQEQKRAMASQPTTAEPEAAVKSDVSGQQAATVSAASDALQALGRQTAAPVESTPARPQSQANGRAAKPLVEDNAEVDVKPPSEGFDEPDPYTRKARGVLDRFYRALARKVIHPTGVKATVDMPPELFWRVKRYCHDHNNVTVRQLFLDVVSALLDEEGY